MKNIVIIGAGASGMMCAIEAAKNNINAHITILEHNMSAGRKILTTGNGRCNLTNMNMDIKCYRSHDMDRLEELLSLLSPDTVINCFNSMGMLCASKNGYIYPYSNQASSCFIISKTWLSKTKSIPSLLHVFISISFTVDA